MTIAISRPSIFDPDADWRDHAACRETSPELFFPVGTTGLALEQIDEAKAVCAGCSGQAQCLEYALATNQDAGVWGGLSEEERRVIRRKRRADAKAQKLAAADRAAREASMG